MLYHLVINEGLSNNLIRSQVIEPVRHNSLEEKVGIISIEKPFSRKEDVSPVRQYRLPVGIPYRLFLFSRFSWFTSSLAFVYALIVSLRLRRGDKLIARSYFPGLVAYYVKKIKKTGYIFDPRSLFIQENIVKRNLRAGDKVYINWQAIEKKILRGADQIIVVAKQQAVYYQKVLQGRPLPLLEIPCYASRRNGAAMPGRPANFPFGPDDIVICYYGSLDHGWNNIDMYARFFLESTKKGYKVLVISQNFRQIQKLPQLANPGIFILDTETYANHSDYMVHCDFGVVLMPQTPDWETRLGVKFVEYLNSGLGVIVGQYVGEAVRFSRLKFSDVSRIYQQGAPVPDLEKISPQKKSEIHEKAQDLFGLKNFRKVISVYEDQ